MADIDKIIAKAKEIAEVVADASVEIYKTAEEKTKLVARIAKLKAEIAGEKTRIKKQYLAIGKKYYSAHIAGTTAELDEEVKTIEAAFEAIADKTTEIERLKTEKVKDEDIDVEIHIVNDTFDEEDDDSDSDDSI